MINDLLFHLKATATFCLAPSHIHLTLIYEEEEGKTGSTAAHSGEKVGVRRGPVELRM